MTRSSAPRDTFRPDAEAMFGVRAAIESRLVDSLHYLVDELEPLPADIATACRGGLARLTSPVLDPALHGLHADMRGAALRADKPAYDTARRVFSEWRFDAVAPRAGNGTPAIRSLAEGDYDSVRRRILTAGFADDVGLTTQLVAPPAEILSTEVPTIGRACRLAAELAPDWFDEFSQLVSEIILATNAAAMAERNFAGGSVFDLFGALLVNPTYRTDIAHYLMTIIHESSHLRLFCYHLDDEVVLNDDVARYHSPLRRQLRPMEGIFHAMWVSARMAVFGHELLARAARGELMSPDEVSLLRDQVGSAIIAFRDGHFVVQEHADLTDLGQRLAADATRAVEAIS